MTMDIESESGVCVTGRARGKKTESRSRPWTDPRKKKVRGKSPMDTLPEEIQDMVVDFLPMINIACLARVSLYWRYICITHPQCSWWHRISKEEPWDDDDDDYGCSCGCGAECDMFCEVETYRWERRNEI